MWLLIKTKFHNKQRHMLFQYREDAEEYLMSQGAKRKGRGDHFVAIEVFIDGDWTSETPVHYDLEFLKIR
ncbi:hypothetical protein [Enterococcus sp. AZ072]|uniref:hypothetical protein n=1 Tax=unclassified Enterococcus TaxID=2608891 RepID=UPI003D28B16E